MSGIDIDVCIDRIAQHGARSSWRIEIGDVDPELVSRAVAGRKVPADVLRFLGRVITLENREGDVMFFTARDLADATSRPMQRLDSWRRIDLESVRADAHERARVEAFWTRIIPVVASVVTGEDVIAIDPERERGTVLELLGDQGWAFEARAIADTFTSFLNVFSVILAGGRESFDYSHFLRRDLVRDLTTIDPLIASLTVPVLFDTDFDLRSPPRKPTRRRLRRADHE